MSPEGLVIPSVGRIVHYVSYGTPNGEYKPEHRAAIITAVRAIVEDKSDTGSRTFEVDICIFNPTGLFFLSNAQYQEVDSLPKGENPSGGTWHWPERV